MTSIDPRFESVRRDRILIAILVVVALVPYAQTLAFGYVMDDTNVIRGNASLNGWTSLLAVWARQYQNTAYESGLYRPLWMMILAIVWNVGGHWALWFHVLAVGMHVVATVMVYRLIAAGAARWPAALAAAWFAVHPLHVEAVANVANSSEVLVAIWTCALAQHLCRIEARAEPIGWSNAVKAGVLFLVALLTKESGAAATMLALQWLWG